MSERLMSSLVILPLLAVLFIKGIPLYLAGLIIMIIGLKEFYRAFNNIEYRPIEIIGYVFAIYLFITNVFNFGIDTYIYAIFLCFLVSIIYVLMQKNNVIDVCITFSGILYVCISFNCIILTVKDIPMGGKILWIIFIISFATDIFAYLAGKNFGRHKLLPLVSPKKTVEGSIGGIMGSIVFCVLFAILFELSIPIAIFVSLTGSIVAQLGDLSASSIKRYVGIKDFGKLIPGHGGILDRFDSVLLVAPYIYLVYSLLLLKL
ncbi:phosphatidate cytidylyltransferase [Peptostreptococcus equinus]|uniref:Phosphatidate cytidylyltransferase n=1 Tax=Peptostreptococcus equinus TaxID=3003601 RepID=A0ABY7JQQ0_9FIRM|nr:phosphatidate cytidylyltransferase [Peptostreptococcus sp. CBA3647]WAW15685.1 phosphatidate cytidylyltransferase [Peptostreptococcus sp. CBA3647]